jgi:hypothetical protein
MHIKKSKKMFSKQAIRKLYSDLKHKTAINTPLAVSYMVVNITCYSVQECFALSIRGTMHLLKIEVYITEKSEIS